MILISGYLRFKVWTSNSSSKLTLMGRGESERSSWLKVEGSRSSGPEHVSYRKRMKVEGFRKRWRLNGDENGRSSKVREWLKRMQVDGPRFCWLCKRDESGKSQSSEIEWSKLR